MWAEKILVVLIKTRELGVPSEGLESSQSRPLLDVTQTVFLDTLKKRVQKCFLSLTLIGLVGILGEASMV